MIRRNFVSAAFASLLAPLGLCRRATAGPTPDDLAVMEQAAGTLKPVEPIESVAYSYQVVWENADGTIGGSIPCETFGNALQNREMVREILIDGHGKVEIQSRPVGAWETMQLPKTAEECRPKRDGRLSDMTREKAEHYRRPDECPNDTLRHPWHNWKEPKAPNPGPDDDPLRVVIPAGD